MVLLKCVSTVYDVERYNMHIKYNIGVMRTYSDTYKSI